MGIDTNVKILCDSQACDLIKFRFNIYWLVWIYFR